MIKFLMIVISCVIIHELFYRFGCWVGWFVASEEEERQDENQED